MGGLGEAGSVFSYLGTIKGAVQTSTALLIIIAIALVAKVSKTNFFSIAHKIVSWTAKKISYAIGKKEINYRRELEIGKIDARMRRVKTYKFLNDLTIDLGLKQIGATPYEFLFMCIVASLLFTIILCEIMFNNLLMVVPLFPIMLSALICSMYTRANIAHDARIEAIIEAENIICNNIKDGVIVAVKNSINVIPVQVRQEFNDFIDNVEHKNYHIRTALLGLNQHIGSTADDFIKKCIVFETEEEHGIVGMFKDVVEINNTKMVMRTMMKRKFEEVRTEFITGASMIFVFMGFVLAIYPDVANFYFKSFIGQMIIATDALVIIGEFVYITYLRAREL